MENLLLRDVRAFRGDHEAPLAPLTLLVGENSTGKSTLLALTRVAWDIAFGATEPDFNEEPFQLGAYEELAHYHGGRGKRATSFSVGFSDVAAPLLRRRGNGQSLSIIATFSATAGQPALSAIKVFQGSWRIVAQQQQEEQLQLSLTTPSGDYSVRLGRELPFQSLTASNLYYAMSFLRYRLHEMPRRHEQFEGSLPPQEELEHIFMMLDGLRRQGFADPRRRVGSGRPFAVAPIRSRPKRTYDPLKEARSPEGDHVPMLLARLSATDPARWAALAEGLAAYGRASGLFDEVTVRRFADNESSPFQLRVKLAGQRKEVNLVDVGYGVSQVLPIIVDSLMERKSAFFLMQQPEVHLHPRAQAELGTFIATLVSQRNHRFLVETHSDYLVDRVRLEVKNKIISPDAVTILFLERSGAQVCIHKLGVDLGGNIVGQPESYRRFFLEEELRVIS